MLKIAALRATLESALPELRSDPTRLRMWIERGTAQARMTASLDFDFSFTLNVLVIELSTDVSVLAFAAIQWMRDNQPDLLAHATDAFSFDADILDNGTADVLLQLTLTQGVGVARDGDGYRIEYLPEPVPLFSDFLGAGGVDPIPPLTDVSSDI